MFFRNSKLDLALSLIIAFFNVCISLLVLALLTDWNLLPFAIILSILFCLYSGFTFITWRAESLEITEQHLHVHFGLKTKQTRTLLLNQVRFERLRTKALQQKSGLVRCQLQLPDEQKITLILRMDTALRLEHYFHPQRLVLSPAKPNQLKPTDVFAYIIADLQWFRRALNVSAIPMIVGILFFPDIVIQIPFWFYILNFLLICLLFKVFGGAFTWLQSRFFLFERHGDDCIVRSGFFVPKTTIFTVPDSVMLEFKQPFGYQWHQLGSIHLTLDEAKISSSKTVVLAPLINAHQLASWLTTHFPAVDFQAPQYRPTKQALTSYLFGAPVFIAIIVSLILGFSSPTSNIPTLILSTLFVIGLISYHQWLMWRSSYLCQLDDAFIIDRFGLTRRFSYCPKQYSQAFIHQNRYQKQNGTGTFRLTFINQTIPTIFFKGISQK